MFEILKQPQADSLKPIGKFYAHAFCYRKAYTVKDKTILIICQQFHIEARPGQTYGLTVYHHQTCGYHFFPSK